MSTSKIKNGERILRLLTLLLFWVNGNCFGQSSPVGIYHTPPDSSVYIDIKMELKQSGEYLFEVTGDGGYKYSSGKWTKKGKMIFLHDSITNGFNINVVESIDTSLKYIKFNPAKYDSSDVEMNAFVWPNSDSTKACLITMDECNFNLKSLKEFRVSMLGKYFSKIYHVKSPKSNVFNIYFKSKYQFDNYYPLEGYRILFNSQESFILADKESDLNTPNKRLIFKQNK